MCQDNDYTEYAAQLYERRREGVILQRVVINIDGWVPVANECHNNVTRLCQLRAEIYPVRGWLFHDYFGMRDYVLFTAHSAVENNGILCDITPSILPPAFPFIAANECEEEYANMIQNGGIAEIRHQI